MKTRIVVNPEYTRCQDFVNRLPSLFETQGVTLYAKRNVVKRFELSNGTPLIVKRFKGPNLAQRIACTLYHPSKARKAYENAAEYLRRGIDTPRPVAYIELSRQGFFHQAYFVSTENDSPDCRVLLDMAHAKWEPLAAAFVQFLVEMHEKGALHGDTNLSNFLFREQPDGTYSFSVIDTNRTRFVAGVPSKQDCLLNLMRLTHEEAVLAALVGRYAELRGWEWEGAVRFVLDALHRFQKRNDMKHVFKHLKRWWRAKCGKC